MKLQACLSAARPPWLLAWIPAIILLAWLAGGCASDSTAIGTLEPLGEMVGFTGCKFENMSGAADIRPDTDCIRYSYDPNTLRLVHVNTAFNCCTEFEAAATVSADTILITEHETAGVCRCLCLYDVEYQIDRLAEGIYRVIVSQEYLLDGDEPLEFTIDLGARPSGEYCVSRDHYPWGD
jgi:hypothetical protein